MREGRERFTGRDLAEALAAARTHFGLPRNAIAFEVIRQQKVGLVSADGLPAVEIEAWPSTDGPRPVQEPADRHRREGGPRGRFGERRGGGRGRDRDERGGRHRGGDGPRGPRHGGPRGAEEEPIAPIELFAAPDVTDATAVLRQLAEGLVGGLGLELGVESIEEQKDVGLRVTLAGGDAHLLTEDDAEGLEALQYLANRLLHKDGRVSARVSFDAGGWRKRAEDELVARARELAAEVLETKSPQKMPAMGPYERRLVHMALSAIEGIRTFSRGSGYQRRLHIGLAGEGTEGDGEGDDDE